MAKITRAVQKIFGSTAGTNGITKFGSTAAGSTEFATSVKDIQSLSAWATGWLGAVLAGVKRKPVYQDRNAVDYVFSSQIAYLLQEGIVEYDIDTTYYTNSIVKRANSTELWKSLVNDNTGNALVEGANWSKLGDLADLALIGISSLPQNYITGLLPSNNVSDANNDIDISVGKARDDSNAIDMILSSVITKRLDAAFAEGNNQGGLNTGAKAINTWYDIYLIAKANGTTDVMFSTFANRNTLPSGFAYKRRIGSIRTDASGNIRQGKWIDNGRGITFYHTAITEVSYIASTYPTVYTNLTITAPQNSKAILRCIAVSSGPLDVKIKHSTNIESIICDKSSIAGDAQGELIVPVDSNSQIQFKSSFADNNRLIIYSNGYIDERVV